MMETYENIFITPNITSIGNIDCLVNHFLLAMPNLVDPNFAKTVVLVVEHNSQGALGLVINRPIDLSMELLFERLDIKLEIPILEDVPIFFGGPAQSDHGFVLHQPIGAWSSTVAVGNSLGLTSSRDILEAVAKGCGPERLFISLGYAGWGPGQLEEEILRNAWLTTVADPDLIFSIPAHKRFDQAFKLVGIENPSTLSICFGHA